MDLFENGTQGYHTFRIPSLITTPTGTVLAFCEGRKNGLGDSDDIDMLMRRSDDGGQSWSANRPGFVYMPVLPVSLIRSRSLNGFADISPDLPLQSSVCLWQVTAM